MSEIKNNRIHICRPDDMHPYNCNGVFGGKCIHCKRKKTKIHDPATCCLCDPEYDYMPNKYWKTPKVKIECTCACHQNEFNSSKKHRPVVHDKKCCKNINGSVIDMESTEFKMLLQLKLADKIADWLIKRNWLHVKDYLSMLEESRLEAIKVQKKWTKK